MTACASFLCDHCKLPGRCCTGFTLNHHAVRPEASDLEVLAFLATVVTSNDPRDGMPLVGTTKGSTNIMIGLPFMPLSNTEGYRRFWCFNLDVTTGRCGDYENRPALCRHFEPGTDELCAMWVESPPLPVWDAGKRVDKTHCDVSNVAVDTSEH